MFLEKGNFPVKIEDAVNKNVYSEIMNVAIIGTISYMLHNIHNLIILCIESPILHVMMTGDLNVLLTVLTITVLTNASQRAMIGDERDSRPD